MTDAPKITSLDAVRLLCNAIQAIHHIDVTGEGRPFADNAAELLLVDAMVYLSHGNTGPARKLINVYDQYKRTGYLPWPYVDENNPNLHPPGLGPEDGESR